MLCDKPVNPDQKLQISIDDMIEYIKINLNKIKDKNESKFNDISVNMSLLNKNKEKFNNIEPRKNINGQCKDPSERLLTDNTEALVFSKIESLQLNEIIKKNIEE